MKILEIRAAGLRGRTPKGGWSNELKPGDCVHTLIAVLTDEGEVGWGSAFTNDEIVRAALAVLRPLYEGANALEPERVNGNALVTGGIFGSHDNRVVCVCRGQLYRRGKPTMHAESAFIVAANAVRFPP